MEELEEKLKKKRFEEIVKESLKGSTREEVALNLMKIGYTREDAEETAENIFQS